MEGCWSLSGSALVWPGLDPGLAGGLLLGETWRARIRPPSTFSSGESRNSCQSGCQTLRLGLAGRQIPPGTASDFLKGLRGIRLASSPAQTPLCAVLQTVEVTHLRLGAYAALGIPDVVLAEVPEGLVSRL
jgi:hypothetical protein